MNKEISVQYAYKKDGKGERHGDQAERMLAAQARKHNVQPVNQPIPVGLFAGSAPSAPASLPDGDPLHTGIIPQANPVTFMPGRISLADGTYANMPQPSQQRPMTSSQPLPAPPSGLPARPPPSQVGYGGPQGFLPPGFNAPPQQVFPPQNVPPPPGFGPPGFGPIHGQNPGIQPVFQQAGYGRAR